MIHLLKRKSLTLTLMACLILCTAGFKGCSSADEKTRNIAFARDLAGSIRVAAPLVEPRNPALAQRMRQAADASDRIVTAIEQSNSTEIATLVRDILPVFTEVAREFSNNQNVLLALALGQIALNFFVNHYVPKTATFKVTANTVSPSVIDDFKSLPQFGCQLRPERCK